MFDPEMKAFVFEKRRIAGTFVENLELYQFPFDTQVETVTSPGFGERGHETRRRGRDVEGAENETPKRRGVENGEGVSPSPADCRVWERFKFHSGSGKDLRSKSILDF